MKDWIVQKRLREIKKNGKTLAENNKRLLIEYYEDLKNNMQKEESEARTLLILLNDMLINYVLSNKLSITDHGDAPDEYTVGKLGLIKAIDKFDMSKGVEFSTYAVKVIQNEIFMYYRKINSISNLSNKESISIEDCMMEDFRGEPKIAFSHNFSEDATFVDEISKNEELRHIFKSFRYLKPIEQIVVARTFGLFGLERYTQEELASETGKSRSYVSKILTTAINKLKILNSEDDKLTDEQKIARHKLYQNIYDIDTLLAPGMTY